MGENRYGESLLQVISKATGINADELDVLAQLWYEQSKECMSLSVRTVSIVF